MKRLILGALCVLQLACGDAPSVVLQDQPIVNHGLHVRYPTVDGFPRSYTLYVPEGVDLDGPADVAAILVLHGVPPADMNVITRMNDRADELGFVAVYPKSYGGGEWVATCQTCTPNGNLGVDDLRYVQAVVTDLTTALPVDPARIAVTGFSNGGLMTFRLACTMADRIAAFAPVGAGMWSWHIDTCERERAVPILMINGDQDPQFPWEGVDLVPPQTGGVIQVPVEEHVAVWAEINGCRQPIHVAEMEDRFDDGTTAERWTFDGCGAETVFYKIEGGGHTWPAMPVDFGPGLGTKSLELEATDSVAAFFLRQRLR